MNPLGIIAIAIALAAGYYAVTAFDLPFNGFFSWGGGPSASGPGSSSEIRNPEPVGGNFFGFGTPAEKETVSPAPGESPHKGKVSIGTVERGGTRAEDEYVTLRYGEGFFGQNTGAPVNVTGWRISSRHTTEIIPRAYNIPEIDAGEQDIFLSPGGEIVVFMGVPSYQRNFRENSCTGYLNEYYSFTPQLSDSCADSRPDRSQLLSRGFNGVCIETIEAVRTCRKPQGQFQADIIGSACIDYLDKNFSYAGCVKNFRDRNNFLGDTWRVSLRRNRKMFDPLHDRVTLRDANGLLVDKFEY